MDVRRYWQEIECRLEGIAKWAGAGTGRKLLTCICHTYDLIFTI